MAQISQSLDQRLLQRLSPQQIQGIKLLELPTLQLEARIKEEIEINPVLEEVASQDEDSSDESNANASLEEYIRSEESANSYKLKANNTSKDDESRNPTLSQGVSLTEFLDEQLSYYNLTERQQIIAHFIIGTLDDDGYLRRDTESLADDIAFTQGIDVSQAELESVIALVQQLDPSGIGARSLGECLLIQLHQLRHKTPESELAVKILTNYYDEFTKKHYDKLTSKLGVTNAQLREAMEEIMGLNPKPANGYTDESGDAAPIIVPDFLLDYVDGVFDLRMTSRSLPELKINNSYIKMAQQALSAPSSSEADKEALTFIRQKVESARWFISAIKQRHETLQKTMRAILDFQKEYFVEGDQSRLKPMILKDIADRAGFDISTISRVVNSKYIQTHFGVFLLKYFFSEGLQTDTGEEVSTREIKRIISECIDNEAKNDPLTDEALMEELTKKGFRIARRTVAKYREMLDIPVARLRKQI